uniref:Uncharacterized protein n=1 Tax=Arundo donax TaxID=35708 RepID=A0A0A9H8F4_ARUDO
MNNKSYLVKSIWQICCITHAAYRTHICTNKWRFGL